MTLIRTRNAQVVGSNPTVGSRKSQYLQSIAGAGFLYLAKELA